MRINLLIRIFYHFHVVFLRRFLNKTVKNIKKNYEFA